MRKFIIRCLFFLFIVLAIINVTLIYYGGYVDYYYNKFASPPAKSMIIGDSRSFQGIQPVVMNTYFENKGIELPVLNYCFTIMDVSYGEPYTESILRKLDPNTKGGIFILSVHPFVLSKRDQDDDPDHGIYFETQKPPSNMSYVSMSPNFEYFFKNFDYFHFRGILRKTSKTHMDGWLEEKNLPDDKNVLDSWKKRQLKLYGKYATSWKKSTARFNALVSLSKQLKNHGKVFIVRLPIAKELLKIENDYWTDFDTDIRKICDGKNIEYINFNTDKNQFNTYDGVHLDKFLGADFTKVLCDSIMSRSELINRKIISK